MYFSCVLQVSSGTRKSQLTAPGISEKIETKDAGHIRKIGSTNSLRPIYELTSPLSDEEEAYLTALVKIKLNESTDKRTVRCKTGGQSVWLEKVIAPRIKGDAAKKYLKSPRARHIKRLCRKTSGNINKQAMCQIGAMIKSCTKTEKAAILEEAGCKTTIMTPKQTTQMRTKLNLSWTKQRQLNKYAKKHGLKIASEREQRKYQETAILTTVKTSEKIVKSSDKTTKEIKEQVIPVSRIFNIPAFVCRLLDEYDSMGCLTWHNGKIPENEVWIKVGGDHGGGSFKFTLQVANLDKPNSPDATHLITLAECPDSYFNLRSILHETRIQVESLQKQKWRGKTVRVFIFGDYDFELKIYGLSPASSCHPCLYCMATKEQIQVCPEQFAKMKIKTRTLASIRESYDEFVASGAGKENAKHFGNVIQKPLFDIELDVVAPPYLHLLLGIVFKHHILLEKDCQELDQHIGLWMAERQSLKNYTRLSMFTTNFVKFVEMIERRKEKKDQGGKKELEYKSGPVTASLSKVLTKHHIIPQAFHGGAFIGNHCKTYLTENVRNSLASNIIDMTVKLVGDPKIHQLSRNIAEKFCTLNELYEKVHTCISDTSCCSPEELQVLEQAIQNYMTFFRTKFSMDSRVTPKQHLLEHHCVPFIRKWGFRLGLHGEQGGEQIHHQVNEIKKNAKNIPKKKEQLEYLVKTMLTKSSPLVHSPQKKY